MTKRLLSLLLIGVGLTAAPAVYSYTTDNQAYELNTKMGPTAFKTQLGTLVQQVEDVSSVSTVQATVGTHLKRVARATWNFDPQGRIDLAQGIASLNVTIPAKALITKSYLEVITKPTSTSSNGKLEFYCQNQGDILNPYVLDSSSAGTFISGYSDGSINLFQKMSSACTLKSKVTVNRFTAGRIVLFVEYVVSE